MNKLNMELHVKLARLQWLMQKQHIRMHAENGPMADPTRGQGRIFALLKMQDGISTKDLSYLLGIRISSLNELLAKMEKNGYIAREPFEADKRVMLVKLTEKGIHEQPKEWNPDAIFACLSEDEQTVFSGYLDRIIAALKTELGEDEDDEERNFRMQDACERIGDERFERFAAMRRGGFDGFGGLPHGAEFRDRPGKPPKGPIGPE